MSFGDDTLDPANEQDREIDRLRTELAAAKREAEEAKRALALKELPDHTLREQLRSAMIVETGQENASLRSQHAAESAVRDRKIFTLERDIAELRDKLAAAEAENDKSASDIEALVMERDAFRTGLDAAREAMGKVRDQLETMHARMDRLPPAYLMGSFTDAVWRLHCDLRDALAALR